MVQTMKISLNNLSILDGDKKLIDNVNLSIESKKISVLLGASGSGKTLTSLAFSNNLPKNLTKIGGEISILDSSSNKEPKFFYIIQNQIASFNPLFTIDSHIKETLKANKILYKKQEIIDLLSMLNLDSNVLKKYSFELSGGMLQRIMILLSLLVRADFIIADEPTSSLDSLNVELFLNLLRNLVESKNIGVLLITHDLEVASKIADDIYIFEKQITPFKLESSPELTLKSLKQIFLKTAFQKREPSFLDSNLVAKNINKSYKNRINFFKQVSFDVLKNVNLELKRGEILGLSAKSGAGKSTLARILANLEKPDSGEVLKNNIPIKLDSIQEKREFYKSLQILFQDSLASLNPRFSVFENFNEVFKNLLGIKNKQQQLKILESIFKELNLDSRLLDSYPFMLSSGQSQRVCLARALIVQPEFLILDEVSSNLDYALSFEVGALLHNLARDQKIGILFISHNREFLENFCDKIIHLAE